MSRERSADGFAIVPLFLAAEMPNLNPDRHRGGL